MIGNPAAPRPAPLQLSLGNWVDSLTSGRPWRPFAVGALLALSSFFTGRWVQSSWQTVPQHVVPTPQALQLSSAPAPSPVATPATLRAVPQSVCQATELEPPLVRVTDLPLERKKPKTLPARFRGFRATAH